ncbi:MAG: hypothetical protein WC850_03835 [Candidatus Gracilibacteria bacterium]
MNFKFIVSKNQKRYDLILQANSEIEARDKLHKEGYSILNVEQIDNLDILGSKFLFTVIKDGDIKNGLIYGEDIFKVYLKLKKEFEYDIISLFNEQDKNKTDAEKKEILKKIEEEYYLFTNKKDKKEEIQKKIEEKKESKKENILEQDFYLKKELEEVYKLNDFVLKKLENIINNSFFEIPKEQKEKLIFIYNSLTSIKNTRNITKLKEIIELALIKIGKIELEYLEKTKDKKILILLKETNNLLKSVGSKKQIIEKDKDLVLILKQKYGKIKEFFEEMKKEEKIGLDKETHSYIKTLVLLKKYEEKKHEVDKEYKKYLFSLKFLFGNNKEKKESLQLKKIVIDQNISILKAKLQGKLFSYTKIIKGYKIIENLFINFLEKLISHITFIIVIYSIIFTTIITLGYFSFINIEIYTKGIMLFIYLVIILFLFKLTRGFLTFAFYFVFLIFLNIFFTVNF